MAEVSIAVGDSALVVRDAGTPTARITYRTRITETFFDVAEPFVVTEDGQKFVLSGDLWRIRGDNRPLTLMPDNASTVEQVRELTRTTRKERHERRENAKGLKKRIDQARNQIDIMEHEQKRHAQAVTFAKERLGYTENLVRQRQRELKQAEESLERHAEPLAKSLDHTRETLTRLLKEHSALT